MKSFMYLTVLLLVGCSQTFAQSLDINLHNKCLYPTVMVSNKEHHGGSGVIIKSEKVNDNLYKNLVLTCHHVYKHGMHIDVPIYTESVLKGYYERDCVVLKQDKDYDFCILLFESEFPLPVVDIDYNTKLFIGKDILKMGSGLLQEARLDFGQITSIQLSHPSMPKSKVRINAFTCGGDSGCGCYDKKTYKLFGILHGSVLTVPNTNASMIGLVSPISDLLTWNKELNNELDYAIKPNVKIPFDFSAKKKEVSILHNKETIDDISSQITVLEAIKKAIEQNQEVIEEQEVAPLPPEK